MNLKKAKKEAQDWLWPYLMFAMYDCCDSMHDADRQEARFNTLVDDKIEITEFVRENLRHEYIEALNDAVEEGGYDGSMECGVSEFPIPWKDIKRDYEKLYGEWKGSE
jgi:hypothetical protein